MRSFFILLLCVFQLVISPCCPGQSVEIHESPSTEERVDQILDPIVSPDHPGCTIAAFKNGEPVFVKGYGMANLDHDIANTPQTVFRIASVSKHVTAVCMLLLEDEGLVDLDTDIRTYLPELHDHGHQITIRHLLHHTSGLREYSSLMVMCDIAESDNWEKEEALRLICRQRGLDFVPGERYSYCNSGYFLCSIICERVSGKTLRQFADENIFQPLKMSQTHFHDESTEVVKLRANGYSPAGNNRYRLDETGLDQVGDGGIYTTVHDFGKWTDALIRDQWKPGLLKRLLSPFTLIDGQELDYRFGIDESTYRGFPRLSHGGSWVGYRSQMWIFPDEGWVFLCFANRSNFNPSRVLRLTSEVIAEDLFRDAPKFEWENRRRENSPRKEPEWVSEWSAEDFTGLYHSDELQVTWRLVARDQGLELVDWGDESYPLQLTTDDRLLGKPSWLRLKIRRDEQGRVRDLEFGSGIPAGIVFKRYRSK